MWIKGLECVTFSTYHTCVHVYVIDIPYNPTTPIYKYSFLMSENTSI